MNEALKRPYEISVWQDALMTDLETQIDYYQEQKVIIIGSDRMTSPNRVLNPVLIENITGELTLNFSLRYKYFDPAYGEIVTNPFAPYLINERKIKLFYNDKWYDFVIKECNESSEEYIFDYVAKDQFSLELGKVGYNITLNAELKNNQGKITDLAEQILKSTDWKVDKKNSDILRQTVKEPLYKCEIEALDENFEVLNVNTNETAHLQEYFKTLNTTPISGKIYYQFDGATYNEVSVGLADNPAALNYYEKEYLYVFYSYIANQEKKFLQFIRESDRSKFVIDDAYVITSDNYRILDEVNFEEEVDSAPSTEDNEETSLFIRCEGLSLKVLEPFNENQAHRLVYSQVVVYDPVLKKTVDLYEATLKNKTKEIYHYNDYEYTTSNVVISYITNGSDFNVYSNGSLQGWSTAVPSTKKVDGISSLQQLNLVTYPEINASNICSRIENFSDIRGFMELKFNGVSDLATGENMYFNSGIEDNTTLIDHIAAGEKYAFRFRGAYSTKKHGTLIPFNINDSKIKAVISKYEIIKEEFNDNGTVKTLYGYKFIPGGALFNFNFDECSVSNNYIEDGYFDIDFKRYIIDDVVQTPSSKYVYRDINDEEGLEYIWNSEQKIYELKTDENYFNYYLTTATANYSVSNTALSDPLTKIGIFLYITDSQLGERYIYIEDIQITKYIEDKNGVPLTIGNIPEATSVKKDYYYLKPKSGMTEGQVNIYGSLEHLAYETGINPSKIKPVYNENCEKILSIEEAQSNCFNLLQSLCETFECWLKIKVRHNEDGTLWLDKDFNPDKRVVFKEFVGKENFAGFRYGINLESISRTIDSNAFVTKLIVDTPSNEYVDGGTLSIQNATANPSNESYILDFSYYLNKGLIANREECNKDLNDFYINLKRVNTALQELEAEAIDLSSALNDLTAKRAVYTSYIDEAKKSYTEALEKFKKVTKIDYFDFVERQEAGDEELLDYANDETVVELIGNIYAYSFTIDNNVGLLSNIEKEYDSIEKQLNGAKEYSVNVTTTYNESVGYTTHITVDKYVNNFKFTLVSSDLMSEVSYETSPNDRIFTVNNAQPFSRLIIDELPENYQVEFYSNNKSYYIEDPKGLYLSIYEGIEEISLTRTFTIVPTPEYDTLYEGIYEKIDKVREEKKLIEKDFYNKYSRFIQEGTWNSTNYIDPDLYYYDALQVSRTSAQPQVSYTINVVEISEIDGLQNYYFQIGDKTFVEDGEFFGYIQTADNGRIYKTPIKEEVIVSEVEWNLDYPEENVITVQNYKTQFEDLFQRVSATVQTLQYNEATYPKISSVLGANGLIDKELLLKSWNEGGAIGYNLTSTGAISTDEYGLMVQDLTNSANCVRIESRGIKTSTDGGQTWVNVIDGYGINADAINAGIINTQQIWLMDENNPSFRWDKAGISAYSFSNNENEPYDLKTYVRFDKYGVYGIQDGQDYIATSLEDIKDTAAFGLTWNGFFIKNSYTEGYVSISSDDDFQIVSTNVEKDIILETRDPIEGELTAEDGILTLLYDDIEVVQVVKIQGGILDDSLVGGGTNSIVNIATTNETNLPFEDEYDRVAIVGEETPLEKIIDYSVEGRSITLENWEDDGSIYRVLYMRPINMIDLGGDGILKINELYVNGQICTDYDYNKSTGVLIINQTDEFTVDAGDIIHLSYQLEHIKIGALDFVDGAPTKYGIKVKNNNGETVFETNDEGNLTVTGTIYANDGVFRGTVYARDGEFEGYIRATAGDFPGSITVGSGNETNIIINGIEEKPYIATSDYLADSNTGWIINGSGDAVFNNISVRGAIKTSVFEYSEIQAVGGAFLFRPSVIIKNAILTENDDLIITLEQNGFFKVGDWCKLSNYTQEVADGLENAGLAAVYKVTSVENDGYTITLQGAGALFR